MKSTQNLSLIISICLCVGACVSDQPPVNTDVSTPDQYVAAPVRPPPPIEAPELLFRDITEWAGLDIAGNHTATGASFYDYDMDGDLDLLLPANAGLALMRNDGTGTFEQVDSIWFEAGVVYTYIVDLTGDGIEDMLVITEHGASAWEFAEDSLVRRGDILNIRDKHVLHAVATFGDYGSTGHNDIILGRSFHLVEGLPPDTPPPIEEPAHDVHLRFDGSSYTDISAQTNVSPDAVNTLSAMSLDLNGDGRLDLIIGTQHDEPDRYLTLNEAGVFEDIGHTLGITSDEIPSRTRTSAMGFDAADVDGDLDLDLFVTDDNTHYGSRLYTQHSNGTFGYATDWAGLDETRHLVSWGNSLADFDHDGNIDLFIANGRRYLPEQVSTPAQENVLYRGHGDGTFDRAVPLAGSGLEQVHQSFGSITGDIDGDGDLDILILNVNEPPTLLRNDMGNQGHWLSVELVHPTLMPAVGSVVTVHTSDGSVRRWLHGTPSFGGSSQQALHFGLGTLDHVTQLEIQWPDGKTTTHGPYNANQALLITYPSGE